MCVDGCFCDNDLQRQQNTSDSSLSYKQSHPIIMRHVFTSQRVSSLLQPGAVLTLLIRPPVSALIRILQLPVPHLAVHCSSQPSPPRYVIYDTLFGLV